LREALLGQSDRLFSVTVDAHDETYHVSRRTFEVQGELHTLLVVKHLTREISRREVDVLKRVVRIISHEVNNSLAPVSSLVHSARLIAKNPQHLGKLDKVFDTIEERSAHLSGFLEGYATLARLPEPRPKDVPWVAFLGQIQTLHPEVRLGPLPETPGYFDAIQLEQVLLNVIKNAAESGSKPSDIELHARSDATGASEFKVLDRGGGFSEEALKNALLPMYSTKERGTGMGLALCREIVEAHGGSLGLTNREDGGAAVVIRLPGRHLDQTSDLGRSRLTLTRA
jgi:nitrogen fixation/metabolism regulation signal transduction histidine kinase